MTEARDRLRARLSALIAAGEQGFSGRGATVDQTGRLRIYVDAGDAVLVVGPSRNGTTPGGVVAFGEVGGVAVILTGDASGRVIRETQLPVEPFDGALRHPGPCADPRVAPVMARVQIELGVAP